MIQTSEPTQLISGYSSEWQKRLPVYASSLYTLNYVLRNSQGKDLLQIEAESDGPNTFTVAITPAQSAGLAAGDYSLIGYVTDDATGGATDKVVVFSGTITIKPDPLTAKGDLRSHNRRMVDLLRSALEKLAKGTVSNVTVNGKSYSKRSLAEVRMELARYEEALRQEESAARLGANINPNRILVRFTPTGA
jgi:hypothetical protein